MEKKFGVLFVFFLLTILCCDKDYSLTQSGINCKLLKEGFIQLDNEKVKAEISKLLIDLTPKPSYFDSTGHLINFGILFSRIEQCDGIFCDMSCYCCIQTYPAISEISIQTDSCSVLISRIIDILTPETDTLAYWNLHLKK